MMKSATLRIKPDLVFPLLISVIIALYVFYLDEGKYNFVGITDFENLVFLGVYVFMLLGLQRLIQIGLEGIRLTRNTSPVLQSLLSAIVLIALLFAFFISFK